MFTLYYELHEYKPVKRDAWLEKQIVSVILNYVGKEKHLAMNYELLKQFFFFCAILSILICQSWKTCSRWLHSHEKSQARNASEAVVQKYVE